MWAGPFCFSIRQSPKRISSHRPPLNQPNPLNVMNAAYFSRLSISRLKTFIAVARTKLALVFFFQEGKVIQSVSAHS